MAFYFYGGLITKAELLKYLIGFNLPEAEKTIQRINLESHSRLSLRLVQDDGYYLLLNDRDYQPSRINIALQLGSITNCYFDTIPLSFEEKRRKAMEKMDQEIEDQQVVKRMKKIYKKHKIKERKRKEKKKRKKEKKGKERKEGKGKEGKEGKGEMTSTKESKSKLDLLKSNESNKPMIKKLYLKHSYLDGLYYSETEYSSSDNG